MSPVDVVDDTFGAEDKGLVLCQPIGQDFDELFDLTLSNFDHDSLDLSDHSNDSNLFEELTFSLAGNGGSIDPSARSGAPSVDDISKFWSSGVRPLHFNTPVPKTRRIVYERRPDGVAITCNQLLNLEGKKQAPTLKSTRAATPPQRSSHPGSPLSSKSRNQHSLRRPNALARALSPKAMHSATYCITRDSPSFQEWTERFGSVNLHSASTELPLSPPSSTRLAQSGQPFWDKFAQAHATISPEPSQDIRTFEQSQLPAASNALWEEVREPSFDLPPPQWEEAGFVKPQPTPGFDAAFDAAARADSQPFNFDPSLATQGLMISCGPFQEQHDCAFSSSFGQDPVNKNGVNDEYSSDVSPTTTPQHHRNAVTLRFSRSPSPSTPLSPITPVRQRHRHLRHRSRRSQTPRTPRTPKTPSSSSGSFSLGFVNFTPNDSAKILTGVAPSGSSKTKARREREAIERRRKLSEFAAKAIREAGGDIEALEKEGLFV